MDGATSYDIISVLVNSMARVGGLGPHATLDYDAADGRFKYYWILIRIIIEIITNIHVQYYYYYY